VCFSHLIYIVRPCLIHTCHAMPMPRSCHALTMPFFSRPRHRTAVERWPVGYLPAFGFFRLPRGVPRSLSEVYQSSSQRSIPTTVKSGSSTLQKRRYVRGRFTHSMPCPCRAHGVPLPCRTVNSHMLCRTPALLRQCRVVREIPRGSRKYPNFYSNNLTDRLFL